MCIILNSLAGIEAGVAVSFGLIVRLPNSPVLRLNNRRRGLFVFQKEPQVVCEPESIGLIRKVLSEQAARTFNVNQQIV